MITLLQFIPIDILLGVLAFFISWFIINRKEKDSEEVVLVDKDNLDDKEVIVLEAVKNGAKNLGDVMRMTGLPKATAYRKIKSLIKKGKLKVKSENGKRYIYINNEEKKKNNNNK
ncbi:hypothetical protein SJAV_03060 [Sulfurisphaera javensis]|uniref:Transcription regulator TrmB N-terminal domain-containing protein n=1 Tax=Sulfurisphaera javensis TaxID=2049879 RepID=A0AAT9GNB3_9CREN